MTPVNFPIHTAILISLLSVVLAVLVVLVLAEGLRRTGADARTQRTIVVGSSIALGVWFVARLALAIGASGPALFSIPVVVGLTVVGLLIGLLPLLWAPFRRAVLAIPLTWLIGIHTVRLVGGSYFVTLQDANLLPANFAVPAGYGDIFVSLLSIVVIYLLTVRPSSARPWIIAWLFFGFLDFISAFVTGGQFLAPFGEELARTGGPTAIISHVLIIPTYIVPILAVLQIYVVLRLLRGPAQEVQSASAQPT